MDTASDFDSIFFARAWCCCWFVVRWFKARINFQIRAAADFWFFLPCEQTPFFSFFKFRRKPLKSIGCSRVVVVYKIYNTHTTFHPQHNNKNTCRTTKVAVPLLMSTSTTIYSPVQTCVLFNVIVSRVNSRFCSCCVCWYFSLRQQRTASSSSSSSSLTLLLLMKNNLKHTVRCCHQVQDCCRLREWYVFIKLFFFSSRLCFVRRTDSKYFSAALEEERKQKQYSA